MRAGERGWVLEDRGDQHAHDLLSEALRDARPNDVVLSEEGLDDPRRTDHDRVWIVDPLDGSSGFGQGTAEWAVHVALVVDGLPHVGAVGVPGLGLVASTAAPPVTPVPARDRPVVVTGRSRSWVDGGRVATHLDAELATCSSAGLKAMLVATGEADVYVHDAPLYEWDVCAPMVVAQAAGLHVSDGLGRALEFNRRRPVVPSLVVCRPDLADSVLEALRIPETGDPRWD